MTGPRRRPLPSRRDDDGDSDEGSSSSSGASQAPKSRRGFEEASDSSVEHGARSESRGGFAEADLLPKLGGPVGRGEADRAVRAIVGEFREACGACRYRRICGFAPVGFQIARVAEGEEARHAHHRVLKAGVARLEQIPGWDKALLALLAEREKDALLAGCFLATAWAKRPEKIEKLVAYTANRCQVEKLREEAREKKPEARSEDDDDDERKPQAFGMIDPEKLRARMFRGQVLRIISFARSGEQLKLVRDLLVMDEDDEGRLFQYEAVAALALLVGMQRPGEKWIDELESKALSTFRATFAARDAGDGAIDVFFPYRRGKRRSYLYFRRDKQGGESVVSVDKIRTDSLLYRTFRVFDSDEKKTWRVFKELCRHLNVRAGKMNADLVLAGFERIARDDLLLLGLYAPALARAVGHFIGVDDYHLLVKFLYKLRAESGRRGGPRVAAHEKVADAREEWRALRGALGDDFVKEVFALLFRLNSSYVKASYTTDTYIKVGEVAYLLTALAGWNPKGLEMELKKARKPLALIAYGLQPPDKWSAIRVKHLARAKEKVAGDADLERAAEIGMRYMARSHRFESFAALEEAALAGKLPENGVAPDEPSAARDLEVDSEPSARRDRSDEVKATADRFPTHDPEADDTGVDLDAPELETPGRSGSSRRSPISEIGPPPGASPTQRMRGNRGAPAGSKGLVGQRNLSFDDDESEERPSLAKQPARRKPLSKRASDDGSASESDD